MAVPLDPTSKQLRGLALPATKEGAGYFASKDRYEVAWGDLMLALLTARGTRPRRRNFGSGLSLLAFEPNDGVLNQLVNYVVRDTADTFVPQIIIENVVSVRSGNRIIITISFSLTSDAQVVERGVELMTSQIAGTSSNG